MGEGARRAGEGSSFAKRNIFEILAYGKKEPSSGLRPPSPMLRTGEGKVERGPMLTRRAAIAGLGASLAAPALLLLPRRPAAKPLLTPPPVSTPPAIHDVTLEAKARRHKLLGA